MKNKKIFLSELNKLLRKHCKSTSLETKIYCEVKRIIDCNTFFNKIIKKSFKLKTFKTRHYKKNRN